MARVCSPVRLKGTLWHHVARQPIFFCFTFHAVNRHTKRGGTQAPLRVPQALPRFSKKSSSIAEDSCPKCLKHKHTERRGGGKNLQGLPQSRQSMSSHYPLHPQKTTGSFDPQPRAATTFLGLIRCCWRSTHYTHPKKEGMVSTETASIHKSDGHCLNRGMILAYARKRRQWTVQRIKPSHGLTPISTRV